MTCKNSEDGGCGQAARRFELQGEKRTANEELAEEAQRVAPNLAALGISCLKVDDEVEEVLGGNLWY